MCDQLFGACVRSLVLLAFFLTLTLASDVDCEETVDCVSSDEIKTICGTDRILKRLSNIETAVNFKQNWINDTFCRLKSHETDITKRFHIVIDSKKNWFQAFTECRKNGMDLASIESEEEYKKVTRQILALGYPEDKYKNTEAGIFWLSATDFIQKGKFVWMSSGHNVRYHKWGVGEPNVTYHSNGEVQHCVDFRYSATYKMYNSNCNTKNYYICEERNIDLSSAAATPSEGSQDKKIFTVTSGNKMNWFGALADCRKQGLRLATIDSVEEQQEVVDLIKSQGNTNFWLSGSNEGRQARDFVWMTTGHSLTHRSWHSGKPEYKYSHSIVEHCIVITKQDNNYLWNNTICLDKHGYICDNHI